MLALTDFYSAGRITLPYLAWGPNYTIIWQRHNGVDLGRWGGHAPDVPALISGIVVRSEQTEAIGRVVVIDTGMPGAYRYHSYCHLRADAAQVGDRLEAGYRVGTLAQAWENPGLLWDGLHMHFVIGSHPECAYMRGTGATFTNPAEVMAGVLSGTLAGLGSHPFTPPTGGTMLLFNGVSAPDVFYLAEYEGRSLKVRPTVGVERKLLLGAEPRIPRGQLTDAEVIDLCAQGGYVFDAKRGVGLYDGVPGYTP